MEGQIVLPFYSTNYEKIVLFSFLTVSFTSLFAQSNTYWQQHVDYKMEVSMDVKPTNTKGKIGIQ
jgi:hypothetical protein